MITPQGAQYERERAIEFVRGLDPQQMEKLREELTGPNARDFEWRVWWRASPPVSFMAGLLEALSTTAASDATTAGLVPGFEESPGWHVCGEACSHESAEIADDRSVELHVHREGARVIAAGLTVASLDGSTTLRLTPEGWETFRAFVRKAEKENICSCSRA